METKGFSRFRIAEAAALAGVSRGGQTHHFATKDELIEAAIEALFDKQIEIAKEEANIAQERNVVASATKHIEQVLQSSLYKVILRLVISAGSTAHFADGVRAISARSRESIDQAWIDRFMKSGVDRKKAEMAFGILSTSLRSLAIQESLGDECGDTDDVKELTMRLVQKYLVDDE